jgi:hypothetical protein
MNKTPIVRWLLWGIGPIGEQPMQTGMDIAIFQHDKIQALYVFLD